MANRSMTAKADRAKRQRMALGKLEGSKPLNTTHFTIEAANAKRNELEALVRSFKGTITHAAPGPRHNPMGKQRRAFDNSTGGNFKPRRGAVLAHSDVYGLRGYELVARGVVTPR